MRVLSVVSVLSSAEGGGNAERVFQLTKSLTNNGVQCVVVTLDIGDLDERATSLKPSNLIALPCLSKRYHVPAVNVAKLVRLVKSSDIVHMMGYWSPLAVIIGFIARKVGVPYVVSPGGALPIIGRSAALKRLFDRFIGDDFLRKASGWIAITPKEIPDFVARGIKPQQLKILPNGVQDQEIVLINDDEPQKHSSSCEFKQIILFVGRLNPVKGPDLLIESFSLIHNTFPDCGLIMVGPDEGMRHALRKRCDALGIARKVKFLGFVPPRSRSKFYQKANFLVVPSRSEAMSIVALEAGAVATPVLMTNQCGLDELKEIDPRLIVPVDVQSIASSMSHLLSDAERTRNWGITWQNMVKERFLWSTLSLRFEEYLRSLSKTSKKH